MACKEMADPFHVTQQKFDHFYTFKIPGLVLSHITASFEVTQNSYKQHAEVFLFFNIGRTAAGQTIGEQP